MKRKDVQRLAAELADAIDALRTEMAMQDATIQRQAAEIQQLRGERPKPIGTFLFTGVNGLCPGSMELVPDGKFDRDRVWSLFGKHVIVTLEARS